MTQHRPPLLPADRYLASLLGLSEEDYRRFRSEVEAQKVEFKPGEPVAGLETLAFIGIIATVVSVGLTIAASFFKPKASEFSKKDPAEAKTTSADPVNRVSNQKFAPRYGFDAVQKPASLGTTIPLVYAHRQQLPASSDPPRPAGRYGGIRVNGLLVWSQLWSLKGSQLLRAIFLLGEGRMACIDANGFAIGDTSLASYDLQTTSTNEAASRVTIYSSPAGGRITSDDRVAGRSAANDLGNAANDGGPDVFALRAVDNAWAQDFCFTSKPSTTTVFGLYAHIPNYMMYRVAPQIRPTVQCYLKPHGRPEEEQVAVECDDDAQALADFWASKYAWSLYSGLVSAPNPGGINEVGGLVVYRLDKKSDVHRRIVMDSSNTDNTGSDTNGEAKLTSIGGAVAARQHAADENLIVGELYRIGSCLAVLESRSTEEPFISDADNEPPGGGRTVDYTFRIVRRGVLDVDTDSFTDGDVGGTTIKPEKMDKKDDFSSYDSGYRWGVATSFPQLFRCAIATASITRPSRVFEVGFKSTVGLQVQSLTNFRGTADLKEINRKAGNAKEGTVLNAGEKVNFAITQSGIVTVPEERFSFWRVHYRKGVECFEGFPHVFGVRSSTSQAVYNYLRFQMPVKADWEIRCEPISGWEIRSGYVCGDLYVLDGNKSGFMSVSASGVTITFTGYQVPNDVLTFLLMSLEPQNEDLGHGYTDEESMFDMYGKLAEAFVYDELTTTIQNGPEHEIVYINTITENETLAEYSDLALLGLNIRAALEWQQFAQFSAYVTGGKIVKRLLQDDSYGQSSLFPDIYRDLLRSNRYGTGNLISDDQIDTPSFIEAAQWCQDRRYFMDVVMAEKTNLREWAADTAATMLLDLSQRDGKFALTPAVVFDTPVAVRGLFTNGNIVEDSFAIEFLSEDDREPIQVSVKWREERARDNYTSYGFFPTEREVLVREADRPDTDPIESFDLSTFCTNLEHAIDFACYIIRMRRLVTHSIRFETTPDGIVANLAAGDYIQVAIDYSYFDVFANGVVLADGTLVTSRPDLMPQGSHACIVWDGTDNPVGEATITVDAQGKASPTGVLFTKKETGTKMNTYKIESIDINQDGIIAIEAVHHPVDENGFSLLGKNWTTYVTDANWVIQR